MAQAARGFLHIEPDGAEYMSNLSRHFASAFEAVMLSVCGMQLKLLPLCSRSLHRMDTNARQHGRHAPSYPEL